MANCRIVQDQITSEIIIARVKWCQSYWNHFRGLMFQTSIDPEYGLLFVYDSESIVQTTIHMFFVPFAISVIWLDAEQRVVDRKIARPWRPYYAPARPAMYFIEAHPSKIDQFEVGQSISFAEEVPCRS